MTLIIFTFLKILHINWSVTMSKVTVGKGGRWLACGKSKLSWFSNQRVLSISLFSHTHSPHFPSHYLFNKLSLFTFSCATTMAKRAWVEVKGLLMQLGGFEGEPILQIVTFHAYVLMCQEISSILNLKIDTIWHENDTAEILCPSKMNLPQVNGLIMPNGPGIMLENWDY